LQAGRREYALLLFPYNTGARAGEASGLIIGDLHLDHASVDILGKGRKRRQCPLWPRTVGELRALVADRLPQDHVFLNRCGQPMTRFGVHALVERTAAKVQITMPTFADKRVSPHSIRHYLPSLTMLGNVVALRGRSFVNCTPHRAGAWPITQHSLVEVRGC
jgi:integrase/recombinase XerD